MRTLVIDDVLYPNGNLAIVSNGFWSTASLFSNLNVTTNKISPNGSLDAIAYISKYRGSLTEQWIEFTYTVYGNFCGPCLFCNGIGSCYYADPTGTNVDLYKILNGGFGSVLHTFAGVTFASGDSGRFEAITQPGGLSVVLNLYKNSILVGTYTDASSVLPGGYPSVRMWFASATARFGHIVAGDFATPSTDLLPANYYRKTRGIIRRGTRASQPQAITLLEGSLYFVTDESILERSDGTVWQPYSGTYGAANPPVEQTTSITGTQNDFNLSGRNVNLICSNASALIFSGFKVNSAPPTAGDRVIIINNGSSTIRVESEGTGSTAAYRGIFESTRGQIIGAKGAIQLVYNGTSSRWNVVSINPGSAISIPFNAADFTGGGTSTWTVDSGDVALETYQQKGKLLTVWLSIASSTTGGTASSNKNFALPNGFTLSSTQIGPAGACFEATNGWRSTIVFTIASAPTIFALIPTNFVSVASVVNGFDTYAMVQIIID